MTILHTPGTGYPELEAKIAFGLARVGLECSDGVEIEPQPGFYRVTVEASANELNKALRTLANRGLGAEHQYLGQPGIQVRWYRRYLPEPSELQDVTEVYGRPTTGARSEFRDNMCGHAAVEAWGGSKGFILMASPSVGKPAKRDRPHSEDNLRLCSHCGAMAMLATLNFVFQAQIGDIGDRDAKKAVITPIPQQPISADLLTRMQAAQKMMPDRIARGDLPGRTVPLAFVAQSRSAAQLLTEASCLAHTVIFDPSARDRVIATHFTSIDSYARFADASAFNTATVRWMLSSAPPLVDPLMQLCRMLTDSNLTARRKTAGIFARSYVAGVSPDDPRLLYSATASYIGEDVLMIPPEIMTNESINSVASMLRYFVRKRNYGFVDNIRNARYGSHDLERTLSQVLRQAQAEAASATEGEARVWLPDDEEVTEVITLASESVEAFENVKLALALLGLSRWRGKEKEPEPDEALTTPEEEA